MLHSISRAACVLTWGLRLNIGAPLTDYKLPMSSVFICRSRPQQLVLSKVNLCSGPGNLVRLETTCSCKRKKGHWLVRVQIIFICILHTRFLSFSLHSAQRLGLCSKRCSTTHVLEGEKKVATGKRPSVMLAAHWLAA